MTTPTTAGPVTTESGYLSSGEDPEETRLRIRTLVRDTRRDRHLTQAKLGQLANTSRFVINRIEAGATEVSLDMAEVLAQALDLPEIVALVTQRDGPVVPVDNTRDTVVKRMLATPGLQRVRVVLADDFNLYRYLHDRVDDDARLRCNDIAVVVPTIARGRALFGEASLMYGRIEYQVKRLLDLKKSQFYASNSLRLYESPDVIASMLVTTAASGTEAAVWPPMPMRHKPHDIEPATLPVGFTIDPAAVAQLNSHVDGLIGENDSVKSNEALCLVDPDRNGVSTPAFTRYFSVGEDQEEDIDNGEGTAVALIMVIALCPRKRYGVRRRVIAYQRAHSRKDRRRSLFSNSVEEIDIRRARATEKGWQIDEHRSTKGALGATLDTTEFLAEYNGLIPESAFQFSASREMAMFDLAIAPDRFEPVPLPPELLLIDKSRAAIAPRLFVLELRSDQPEPELARLQEVADVDEVGIRDLEEAENLNDFLADARESGFLGELLKKYQIAPR